MDSARELPRGERLSIEIKMVTVTQVNRLMLRSRITYTEGGTHEETLCP